MRVLEGAAAVLRGFLLLCAGVIAGSAVLGRVLAPLGRRFCSRLWRLPRQTISRALPGVRSLAAPRVSGSVHPLPGLLRRLRWLALILFVGLTGWVVVSEMRSGHFQAGLFSWLAPSMTFALGGGASRAIEVSKNRPHYGRAGGTKI